MSIRKSPLIYCSFIAIFFILLLALAISCSEQPTGVRNQPGDTGGFIGEGGIDPGAGDKFLLGIVEDTTFAPGHIEVWAMDVAYDGNTGNISFDVQLGNSTERPIPAPVHFVIISVVPNDISTVDFDGISEDGFPFYDFSSKLGSDNILEPGEISDRATMRFHTGEPRSFSIGFRIDFGLAPDTGIIAGVVFRDDNKDGVRDPCEGCEPGISGIMITMRRGFDKSAENLFITHTDANGEYRFSNLIEGVYTVRVQAPSALWEITSPNPLLVTLIKGLDGKVQDFYGANFGLFLLEGEGLLLWNKLGSAQEVQNSEVGPDGNEIGTITYAPVKFGNGFKPCTDRSAIQFPNSVLSRDNGCIEMWVKPEFDKTLGGRLCYLINQRTTAYSVPPDQWMISAAYVNNTLGLWMYIGGGMPVTIYLYWEPDWAIDDLVHLAFAWDINAENGFTLAIFRNGEKVASTDAPIYGSGTQPGSTLWIGNIHYDYTADTNWLGNIDNVKVWKCPKTDFSDRFEE
jgi:hypothetical protein